MNVLWVGGIVAAISAGWGYMKTLWLQLSSIAVVRCEVQGCLGTAAVLAYLQGNAKCVRFGPQTYTGSWMYMKVFERVQLAAWRIVGRVGSLYILSGRRFGFVFVVPKENSKESNDNGFITARPDMLSVTFIRGTVDPDGFMRDSFSHYNKIRDNALLNSAGRHRIHRIYGVSKKTAMAAHGKPDGGVSELDQGNPIDYKGAYPIGFRHDDVGVGRSKITLNDLALSSSVEDAVVEARRWKASERWYKDHGLPWKRGWLLYGKPGTGKTAIARALAEDLDLPIFIFDLSSLANDEMQNSWREMLASVPCIVLVEDIDAVFDGRDTISGDLTFDCFLNCLDGIERADGLFVVVTTNNVDKVDPALGVSERRDAQRDMLSTRPGRIDHVILMGCPDEGGRMKIAKRILDDRPELWSEVVSDGEGETGAQFQERCSRLALKLYWGK